MRDLGFEIQEGVLTRRECNLLIHAVASCRRTSGRAGARHLMSNRAVRELAHREELLAVARRSLGSDAVPYLIHSSSKAERPDPRRVLHLEYAGSLGLAAGVRLAIA